MSATLKLPPQGMDILELPALREGGELSQADITNAIGRDWEIVRYQIGELVIAGKLTRILGVGARPSMYRLPVPADEFRWRRT